MFEKQSLTLQSSYSICYTAQPIQLNESVVVLLLTVASILCAIFFYCQALQSGMGRKRWATAGFVFGPLVWPMFCNEKRMKTYKKFGTKFSSFNA